MKALLALALAVVVLSPVGLMFVATRPTNSCTVQLEAMQAERVAREGKTDREFYEANPNHFNR